MQDQWNVHENDMKEGTPLLFDGQSKPAAIVLDSNDKFRLLEFPSEIGSALGNLIRELWPRGVARSQPYSDSQWQGAAWEIKLNGTPWYPDGRETVTVRTLLIRILQFLYARGYVLQTALDISNSATDKDVLVFSQQPPPTTQLELFAVSMNETDKVRLIGCPDHAAQAVTDTLKLPNICRGIQDVTDYYGALQYKIRSNPWSGWGRDGVMSRIMLCGIMSALARNGYVCAAAVDHSMKSWSKDSLFFTNIPTAMQMRPSIRQVPQGWRDGTFFSMQLGRSDRLVLYNPPPGVKEITRDSLAAAWPRGVQKEYEWPFGCEFKMRGNPWWGEGVQAVEARRFVGYFLAQMFANGYLLTASIDCSARHMDKDTWIFTPMGERPPPGSFNMCVMSTNESDKLRVIDEPANSGITTQLRSSLLRARFKIQREREYTQGCHEFKVQGNPWSTSGYGWSGSTRGSQMVLTVLEDLGKLGWHLYTTTDISTGNDEGQFEKDTWVLVRHNTPA